MPDFGYSVNADRQIDFDRNDFRLLRYLVEHEPSFKICIACGTCAATCSAGVFTEMSLRAIMGNIKRGEVRYTWREIEKCMLCGKCQLACPRGVNTRNVILNVQRAIEEIQP